MSKANPSWLIGFRPRIPSQPFAALRGLTQYDAAHPSARQCPGPMAATAAQQFRQAHSRSSAFVQKSISRQSLLPPAASLVWSRRLVHRHDTLRNMGPLSLHSRFYSNDKSSQPRNIDKKDRVYETPGLDSHDQHIPKGVPPHGHEKGSGLESESITASVSKYLHFPKMPHRPTKEELLAAATGFWSRLKVRFKWASIRSMRPWNADEWGAFVSWFMLGHIVWILVGTTTFFSLVIFSINTVFAQGSRSPPHLISLARN
jgi:hypothetical protein